MKNLLEDLYFPTSGKGMFEITNYIVKWISKNDIIQGQLNIFIHQINPNNIIGIDNRSSLGERLVDKKNEQQGKLF